MRTARPGPRKHPTLVVLVLLLGLVLAISLATLAAAAEPPIDGQVILTAMASVPWDGNGSEHNCEYGGTLHWILTPGGNATIVANTGFLHVTFGSDSTDTTAVATFKGYFPSGQGKGAMHFDSVGSAQVLSAYATFEYEGTPGNQVLTISHSTCNPTTTSSPSTTVAEVTTTISESTTSTSDSTTSTSGLTTSTTGSTTTDTSGTTTTAPGTSTTAGSTSTTTTEGSTTTSQQTTTSEGGGTSTTGGGETTVPSSESTSTSTTAHPPTSTPTPSQIQTGGGGTAGGPGAGVWSLAVFAAVLGIGLSASGLRSHRKARR